MIIFHHFAAFLFALHMERMKGIEPSYQAWEARILPLNYTRKYLYSITEYIGTCKEKIKNDGFLLNLRIVPVNPAFPGFGMYSPAWLLLLFLQPL